MSFSLPDDDLFYQLLKKRYNLDERNLTELFTEDNVCPYRFIADAACKEEYGGIILGAATPRHYDSWGRAHYENFDLMMLVHQIMDDRCLLIFDINCKPVNTGQVEFNNWMFKRAMFFGVSKNAVQDLNPVYALQCYRQTMWASRFNVESVVVVSYPSLANYHKVAFECVRVQS